MQTKYKIIGLAVIVVVIVLVVWSLVGNKTNDNSTKIPDQAPEDAVLNFYNSWIEAVTSSSTPYETGLAKDSVLSEEVKAYLEENKDSEMDPVLCQAGVPDAIRAKLLFTKDNKAQVQVLGRIGKTAAPEQTIMSLTAVDGEWQISKIECLSGETAPDREYSFEKDGYLLKSVPPPLDSKYWHLVFEEDGVMGHTAPLFFDASSKCVEEGGTEIACSPDQFTEASKVVVKGEMTEAGVNVKYLFHLQGE